MKEFGYKESDSSGFYFYPNSINSAKEIVKILSDVKKIKDKDRKSTQDWIHLIDLSYQVNSHLFYPGGDRLLANHYSKNLTLSPGKKYPEYLDLDLNGNPIIHNVKSIKDDRSYKICMKVSYFFTLLVLLFTSVSQIKSDDFPYLSKPSIILGSSIVGLNILSKFITSKYKGSKDSSYHEDYQHESNKGDKWYVLCCILFCLSLIHDLEEFYLWVRPYQGYGMFQWPVLKRYYKTKKE